MAIYNKLKDAFISALHEVAGLSEEEAKEELRAHEFELRKLAEKVESGDCSLNDAIKEVTKKAEIYSPPAFRQRARKEVGKLCGNSRCYEKPKQKRSKLVEENRGRKVILFSEIVPIPETTKYVVEREGFMSYFNKYQYKSCLALSVYYHFKPVKHVEPIKVIRKKIPRAKKPVPVHAKFEGFGILYDEATEHFEVFITGDVSKYGKDFLKGLKGILTTAVTSEIVSESFCYRAVEVVKSIENGKKVFTEEGLGALFSVLSLAIESCRAMAGNFYDKSNYKQNTCREYINLAILRQLFVTEDEFYWIIENCPPPEGFVWARSPFGAPPGMLKVYLKKDTPPRYKDTDLERKFEEILNGLGYEENVHYKKQYQLFGYHIDFAFPQLKIAFEPGAAYHHTPKYVKGEALKPFGFSPEEVYYPAKPEDIRKDRVLKRNGWVVGWLNENFVKNLSEVKKWVVEIISKRKDF